MIKNEIYDIVVRHTREVIPELENYTFTGVDRFRDFGANSIDKVEIIALTLESMALEIPLPELFFVQKLSDLADVLYERQ